MKYVRLLYFELVHILLGQFCADYGRVDIKVRSLFLSHHNDDTRLMSVLWVANN